MTTAFRHKRASVDTAVLQAAHAENVGMLTQILAAQNQLGARVEKLSEKVDEVKVKTDEVTAQMSALEQRLSSGSP